MGFVRPSGLAMQLRAMRVTPRIIDALAGQTISDLLFRRNLVLDTRRTAVLRITRRCLRHAFDAARRADATARSAEYIVVAGPARAMAAAGRQTQRSINHDARHLEGMFAGSGFKSFLTALPYQGGSGASGWCQLCVVGVDAGLVGESGRG